MASLKAQYDALKQQHEFTVIQLSDLKQDYQKIKKLNTTILQNMMKESPDTYNEIKVNIDGTLYNQKIIDLQAQLELLRGKMNEQIQRRVQELMKNTKSQKPKDHDCSNCQKCLKILQQCPNCKRLSERIKSLQKYLQQKTQRIDRLRLQVQQKKSDIQIIQSRKNQQKSQKMSEMQQAMRNLRLKNEDLQLQIRQNEGKYGKSIQQWESEFNNLNNLYQQALNELEQYKSYINKQESELRENSQNNKKTHMMKEIQNILGELGNRKLSNNNSGLGPGPKLLKYNSSSSRINMQDSDFSNFSIKDAINRPNQFTYY